MKKKIVLYSRSNFIDSGTGVYGQTEFSSPPKIACNLRYTVNPIMSQPYVMSLVNLVRTKHKIRQYK